ncbi:putative tyrosine-protein phosphatase [Podospora fimiseda]|uniref:protein-tyrosine-phosphatase n=1 Tax=Podospora fimiseda TaxID=252190 RepID=A0AAN7BHD4_9PEZI|nr:putative tyrosine-protein phosphatase [Podospora fimiseda]
MPPEPRVAPPSTPYYTMKTSNLMSAVTPHPHGHSRNNSQSFFGSKSTNTPLSSPRGASYSVGQQCPQKSSPGASRGTFQDARTPSPNYFGMAIEASNADPRDSALLPHDNWSSPTSSVKSFVAAIPKQLPLDANPEFEAFKRQIDANRGKGGFNLSATHFNLTNSGSFTPTGPAPPTLQRPCPPRWHTHGSDTSEISLNRPPRLGLGDVSSKNTSEPSFNSLKDAPLGPNGSFKPPSQPTMPQSPFPPAHQWKAPNPTIVLPASGPVSRGTQSPSPTLRSQSGSPVASQLPGGDNPAMMPPSDLKNLLEKDHGVDVLILDIRVSPQYAQARVRGALNLCIPTTLLKRATFTLQKLQQNFQANQEKDKFANWRNATHLVVYDASSADHRDATSAMNMIKKFTNEGYSGSASILRGGFNMFASLYPSLIDKSSTAVSPSLSLGGPASSGMLSSVPPVIGGVMLPKTADKANPFFSNIRQNQDLIDGVGQMDVSVPAGLEKERIPQWLRDAAATEDHGKKVSDKFLQIELTEQSRMKDAYSAFNASNTKSTSTEEKVQLSGIEKGGKNRYKDILPFEHARVKLLGRPEGACDYVNASHIRAKRSYKRYIASQGPLPATFDDFWSMVWDNDVRVIVMLTAESEGGQLKCHPYWKGRAFGPIRLRALSEKKVSLDIDKHRSGSASSATTTKTADVGRRRANTTTTLPHNGSDSTQKTSPPQTNGTTPAETPYVTIRKFALSHAAHPFAPIREITHLHYTSWPDFGAPAQPSQLLALVELANVMQRASLPTDSSSNPQPASATGTSTSSSTYFGPDGNPTASFKRGDSFYASPSSRNSYEAPESNEHARPMLVHCSAGCGRTGTFCTVDSVIDMLKRQRLYKKDKLNNLASHRSNSNKRSESEASEDDDPEEIDNNRSVKRAATLLKKRDGDGDIVMDEGAMFRRLSEGSTGSMFSMVQPGGGDHVELDTSWMDDEGIDLVTRTVEEFRGQRLSMVQSLRQFVLCYETVLEWIARVDEYGSPGGMGKGGRGRSGSLAF